MKKLSISFQAYRLVWVRTAFYFFIPSLTLFLTQTETWSDETWSNSGAFSRARLIIACCIAGSTALAAYIDQSLNRARSNEETMKLQNERPENLP